VLPQRPVAALEAIKNLGTNGGGFFNVNGAHPYANPTPLSNFLGMLAIVLVPAALTHTFGLKLGRPSQGWMLFSIMTALFITGLLLCDWAEQSGNPRIAELGVNTLVAAGHTGGNMEGKETRFGIGSSVLAAITTSNGATGSYNSMHDSYMPLGGAVPLVNMLLGEIVFGGLGSGIYSIVFVMLIGVFVAGLMIGRTPEFLGKQITVTEMKLIGLYTVMAPLATLTLTAVAVTTVAGQGALYHAGYPFTTIYNPGPHGFTEVFYAYTSAVANNGQNFAGLGANNPFYNVSLVIAMMIGRFGLAVPALALAGVFAQQKCKPPTPGTLATDSPLFGMFTIGIVLIVGVLSYLPALALGPIIEHIRL
jgi:K+-transporting ATPase ATPase A chain